MKGSAHARFAPVVALPLASLTGMPPLDAAAMTGLAVLTGGWHRVSPDADQTWLSWVPGGHRGLTHWWGWPVAAAVFAVLPWTSPGVGMVLLGLCAGWGSHVLGDFLFGDRSSRDHRDAGVPMWLWRGHRGLLGRGRGLRSDGTTARLFIRFVVPALIGAELWWLAPGMAESL